MSQQLQPVGDEVHNKEANQLKYAGKKRETTQPGVHPGPMILSKGTFPSPPPHS